ncbi:MAG: hypothetical protein FJY82_04120 [Candidatus Aminicenantes bacterium]|nr:hypothetical protein [Candidatus Aminicenantes bacterium]
MKFLKVALAAVLCLVVVSSLQAQLGQTGSIRGRVLDDQKTPLPGVTITVTSPALMGKQSVVSAADGTFKFPPILPPGVYTVVLELPGFNTVKREEVIIRVGVNVDLSFEMSQAALSQEITVTAPSPVVDVISNSITQSATTEIIKTMPFANRDVWTFVSATAAGVVGNRALIHGEGAATYTFKVDGIQSNASDQNWPENSIDMETVEEVEFVTGAVGSDQYGARSGYMNVVTKSGGNEFHGAAQFYYTGEKLQEVLSTDEQLASLGLTKPAFAIYNYDASGTLGGPILRDKLWFFASYKFLSNKNATSFIPVTIAGVSHESYDRIETRPYFFGKLTFQLSEAMKLFSMLTYVDNKINHYYTGWNLTASASAINRPIQYTSSNGLTWILNPDTFLDVRAGLYIQDWTGRYTAEAVPGPRFNDSFTGHIWGNRGMQEYTYKQNLNVAVNLVRYQDDFLGGNHEFRAGAEWARIQGEWGYWRDDPLNWTYYNGNPYSYRGLYNLSTPHPLYGDGLLNFSAYGTVRGDSQQIGFGHRLGLYVRDSMKIKDRLTISLGLRFDKMWTHIPTQVKGAAGGSLAAAIGDYYFVPAFGFNPFKELTYEGWENCYPYNALAPTIGASYDLFGDGRTALKIHYGTYFDPAATGTWSGLQPSGPRTFNMYWTDLNLNGQPDAPPVDSYVIPAGTNPLTMLSTTFKQQINSDLNNPYTREVIAQVEHELFPHLKVGLNFIYRDRKDFTAYLNYDQASGTHWNLLEQHPEWWVPFTTTVPAYLGFPAETVTVYYRKLTSPATFTVLTNVPEQKFRYQGLELTFSKRMHKGWSLGGNFNYSYQWNNGSFTNPNTRVNAETRAGIPWWAKLYGTFKIPYGFILSFIYTHTEGGYWGRSVSVSAPTAWIQANGVASGSVSITIERPDTRRNVATDNTDFRIEKEFPIGNIGRLGVFADIFNLFGSVYPSIVVNPAGTWSPVDNNSSVGTYTPGQMRVTGISGVRSYRFSIRFNF